MDSTCCGLTAVTVTSAVFLGIDIGTSGIRASCINANQHEIVKHHISFESQQNVQNINEQFLINNEQNPSNWRLLLNQLLFETSQKLKQLNHDYRISAIAIDGTSSTLLACKKDGSVLSPALMYNDSQSQPQAKIISRFAPAESAVHGASSSLAKALNLLQRFPQTELFCHQADWLAASLTGCYGISDENNCLKLGYDSITQQWPDWLFDNEENAVLAKSSLPQVLAPGSKIGAVKTELIEKYQFAENCIVVAGTTDSNAAVLATGCNQLGDAVTSLGSTLVVKLFSDKPIFNPDYGIYSHRLNGHWLAGGASNSGGSVLLQHFTKTQLDEMTPQLKPEQPTGLHYYPLSGTGERFPENDSDKQSKITPRPKSDVKFFQALLEGMANIEAEAYKKLVSLGAVSPKRIFTAGGGARNPAWTKIRAQATGLPVLSATHSDACYGSALLAKQGYQAS